MRLLILIALFIQGFCLHAAAQPKYEIRAVWLTTLGGMDWPTHKAQSAESIRKQKAELCRILDRLQQSNFNTVLLQTRLRGDVIYPSALEPFAESLTGHEGKDPGYDPLQFAIEECHRRGMELHAWIVTVPVGNRRQVKLQGKRSVVQRKPGLCKLHQDTWYLDPGNPATEDYLASIVHEIVSRYDIDGVHFDYIRYPERADRFPDRDTYRKYGKKQPIDQWRRNNITRIVRRLYTETKALKPWVKVSSSPVGKYKDTSRYSSRGWNAYQAVFQDAQLWLKEGIQDALFPMMYFRGNHFYPFVLDWQENKCGRWVIPGLGIYFLSPTEKDWQPDEILRQIYFTRSHHLDGQAYFRNRFLLDNTKQLLDILNILIYPTPAAVPPMTWADSIAPACPTAPSFIPLERGVKLSWKASSDNAGGGVFYRVYASDSYPVDISRAENIMVMRTDQTCCTYVPSLPWMERLYWAVTAVDRCGNESVPLDMNRPDGKTVAPSL